MLVGLLRAPTAYDPFIYPEAARARRNQVLQNLVSVGDITPAQAAVYKATPLKLATETAPPVRRGCFNCEQQDQERGFLLPVRDELAHLNGASSSDTELNTGGLRICHDPPAGPAERRAERALGSDAGKLAGHRDLATGRPEDRRRPRDGHQQGVRANP